MSKFPTVKPFSAYFSKVFIIIILREVFDVMLRVILLLLIIVGLFFLRQYLVSFLIGVVIAFALDPLVSFLQSKLHIKKILAILLSYLIWISAIVFLCFSLSDLITGEIASRSLGDVAGTLINYYNEHKDLVVKLFPSMGKEIDYSRIIRTVGTGLYNFFIGMVAGIYILKDKKYFAMLASRTLHIFLPQKIHGYVREVSFEIKDVLSAFLRGITIDSSIVGLLSSIALTVIGIPYAVLLGLFVGIANIIPYFGPFIGIAPAVLIAYLNLTLQKALLVLASLVLIQQVECNLIYPRIIGKSTGLHPLFVLICVSLAARLGGIVWMVLAVPLAGIARVLIVKWAESQ